MLSRGPRPQALLQGITAFLSQCCSGPGTCSYSPGESSTQEGASGTVARDWNGCPEPLDLELVRISPGRKNCSADVGQRDLNSGLEPTLQESQRSGCRQWAAAGSCSAWGWGSKRGRVCQHRGEGTLRAGSMERERPAPQVLPEAEKVQVGRGPRLSLPPPGCSQRLLWVKPGGAC